MAHQSALGAAGSTVSGRDAGQRAASGVGTSQPATPGQWVSAPDVLVIGGGIVGLFCAYFLRRQGSRVAVVERGALGGAQSCSAGNTGLVGTQGSAPLAEPGLLARALLYGARANSPLYVQPHWDADLPRWLWHFHRSGRPASTAAGSQVLLRLKKRSLRILHEVCIADLAATFTARGIVLAFKTPAAFAQARQSMPKAVAAGVPLRVLDRDELRELLPNVEVNIAGALYNEEGAYLRIPDFLHQFAALLTKMGVALYPQTEVVDIVGTPGRIERVRTTAGDLRPTETVLAAGVWCRPLAKRLGLRLAVRPLKGYAITVPAPTNAPALPLILSEGRIAVAPLGNRLRFAGTLGLSTMDTTVSQRRVRAMLRTVREYLPGLTSASAVEVWSGLRPATPDSLPLIGRIGGGNLSIACGHGHIGMGLAPATGELIAQIVAGEQPDEAIPLRVDRFGLPLRRGLSSVAKPTVAKKGGT